MDLVGLNAKIDKIQIVELLVATAFDNWGATGSIDQIRNYVEKVVEEHLKPK